MNRLAKINLTVVTKRLGPFKSALFLLSLILLCLFIGYRMGNFYHSFQENNLEKQKIRLEALYQKQSNQVARINALEVELAVEQLANKNAQAALKKMTSDHYQDKKELAFYEKVMAPEKVADGVIIDNVTIKAKQSSNHYSFNIMLIQQQLLKRYAKGYVELKVLGSVNNKPREFNITDISTVSKKNLTFSFKYFKMIEGTFALPDKFIPEKIQLSAILTKSKWQKYRKITKTLPWQIE